VGRPASPPGGSHRFSHKTYRPRLRFTFR
jgi:hypothetical protein